MSIKLETDKNSTNVQYQHVPGKGVIVFIRYDGKPFKSKSSDTMLLASAGGGIRLPNGVRLQVNAMMPKANVKEDAPDYGSLEEQLK